MKIRHLLTVVVAVAGATCAATSANAQSFYTQGDLLMGFRATGVSQDYVVDLGPASNFVGQTLGFSETLSLGAINTDLTTLFGANWESNPNVYWGVAGVDPNQTRNLYAGQVESNFNYINIPYNTATSSTQASPGNRINSVGSSANQYDTVSTNASDAVIQNTSDTNSWASQQSPASFAYFQESAFEGNSTNGIYQTGLDLNYLPYGTSHAPGTYEGTFNVTSAGDVTFAVVPEPSTWASMVVGAIALVIVARRRRTMIA